MRTGCSSTSIAKLFPTFAPNTATAIDLLHHPLAKRTGLHACRKHKIDGGLFFLIVAIETLVLFFSADEAIPFAAKLAEEKLATVVFDFIDADTVWSGTVYMFLLTFYQILQQIFLVLFE
jgi:hypothetical protein